MNTLLICGHTITDGSNKTSQHKYAVVVDAGSSGSRMFVYTWSKKIDSSIGIPQLTLFKDNDDVPVVKKVIPGLSTFISNLDGLQEYIPNMLNYAADAIPSKDHSQTSLYILATAGMRLLSEDQQDEVWDKVRDIVKKRYKFQFHDEHAATITGKKEALYGWIAVNYLLGAFSIQKNNINRPSTYGLLDMGGASTQIAFEINATEDEFHVNTEYFNMKNTNSERFIKYQIYLVSYLNYGANVIRERYERFLLHNYLRQGKKNENNEIEDPCLLNGETIHRNLPPRALSDRRPRKKDEQTYNVIFRGSGNFEACSQKIEPIFQKRTSCGKRTCAIGYITQPEIDFSSLHFYGLTEFHYSLEDVLTDGVYDYETAKVETKILCAQSWKDYLRDLRRKKTNLNEIEFQRNVEMKQLVCFKASYVLATLHFGLNFPREYRQLHRQTHLNGTEVQWSLGALFYMLNADEQEKPHEWQQALLIVLSSLLLFLPLVVFMIAFAAILRRRRRKRREPCPCPSRVLITPEACAGQSSCGTNIPTWDGEATPGSVHKSSCSCTKHCNMPASNHCA